MKKLCLTSRDELIIIDLTEVVYMQANGNYTHIVYAEGLKITVSLGISKLESLIPADKNIGPFVKMGRSLIINQNYLLNINSLKQKVTLIGKGKNVFNLSVPKALLKKYKEQLSQTNNSSI